MPNIDAGFLPKTIKDKIRDSQHDEAGRIVTLELTERDALQLLLNVVISGQTFNGIEHLGREITDGPSQYVFADGSKQPLVPVPKADGVESPVYSGAGTVSFAKTSDALPVESKDTDEPEDEDDKKSDPEDTRTPVEKRAATIAAKKVTENDG